MTASSNLPLPFTSADEEDALTKGKRLHQWRAGERKRIKDAYQRRVRQRERSSLMDELT